MSCERLVSTNAWNLLRAGIAAGAILMPLVSLSCESKLAVDGDRVDLSGCISRATAQRFSSAVSAQTRTLFVRSEGGDIEAGLAIANVIRRNNLSVVVRGYCHSTCANYIIAAARHAAAESGSSILFHGDARTSLREMAAGPYVEPLLISKLLEYAVAERSLGAAQSRASKIHSLQQIARAERGTTVVVYLGHKLLRCRGLGRRPWVPSLDLLVRLNVLDEIVPAASVSAMGGDVSSPAAAAEYLADDTDPSSLCRVKL